MNTSAHILIGAAAFGQGNSRRISIAAVLGALVPDVSLYVLSGVSILILGISPQIVFDELYFSQSWQIVFSIDNSFILWGLLLGYALVRKNSVLVAFAAAALLHISTDFLMHHEDARAQFWPISNWRFLSPISYWDSTHHANWVAPLEGLMTLACGFVLWRRHKALMVRTSVVVLLVAELLIIRQWLLFF